MWLPKNERRLLLAYYVNIGEIERKKWFIKTDWYPVLRSSKIKRAAGAIKGTYKGPIQKDEGDWGWDNLSKRSVEWEQREAWKDSQEVEINRINNTLKMRKLINVHFFPPFAIVVGVSLTIEGYDLGRKYNSWLSRSGLWFAEYKDHWFWLIISFVGGIIGALIVNWLSK